MLVVESLTKTFTTGLFKEPKYVVDDVSFTVGNNEILGLVGESGCGKTTIGRMVVRLLEPTSGTINVGGVEVTKLRGRTLRSHWPRLQMIFQDPRSSLNPRMKVGESLVEGLKLTTQNNSKTELDNAARELCRQVSVRPEILKRYPHEVSGGEVQRIVLARALSLDPSVVVADEPTSNLDLSVQAQVLRVLKEVHERLDIPFLFVSHDLSVVRWMCTHLAVIRNGRIIETGPVGDVLASPQHEYTKKLIDADL